MHHVCSLIRADDASSDDGEWDAADWTTKETTKEKLQVDPFEDCVACIPAA